METSEKILKHRNSLDTAFIKFKNDVDNIIDDTKHIIIDMEEIKMILNIVTINVV